MVRRNAGTFRLANLPTLMPSTVTVPEVAFSSFNKRRSRDDLPDPDAEFPKGVKTGNSILVNVSGSKYIHIGIEIYSFETRDKEKILHYYSPIGNNDVPYPYAIGENYSYFFLDYTTVPNMVLDLSKDGYTQYYGHAFKGQDREEMKEYHKKVIEPSITKFKHKIIYGRP